MIFLMDSDDNGKTVKPHKELFFSYMPGKGQALLSVIYLG